VNVVPNNPEVASIFPSTSQENLPVLPRQRMVGLRCVIGRMGCTYGPTTAFNSSATSKYIPLLLYRSPAFLQGSGLARGVIFTHSGFASPAAPVTIGSFWSSDGGRTMSGVGWVKSCSGTLSKSKVSSGSYLVPNGLVRCSTFNWERPA
jgi:hypothetical protein